MVSISHTRFPSNAVETAVSPTYTIRNDESFAAGATGFYSKAGVVQQWEQTVWVLGDGGKNGQLSEEVSMIQGVPHGVTRFRREDGEVMSEGPCDNGRTAWR